MRLRHRASERRADAGEACSAGAWRAGACRAAAWTAPAWTKEGSACSTSEEESRGGAGRGVASAVAPSGATAEGEAERRAAAPDRRAASLPCHSGGGSGCPEQRRGRRSRQAQPRPRRSRPAGQSTSSTSDDSIQAPPPAYAGDVHDTQDRPHAAAKSQATDCGRALQRGTVAAGCDLQAAPRPTPRTASGRRGRRDRGSATAQEASLRLESSLSVLLAGANGWGPVESAVRTPPGATERQWDRWRKKTACATG